MRSSRVKDGSELMKNDELYSLMMVKLKENYHQAKQDEDQCKCMVQWTKQSTDFVMRIIVPVEGQGGSLSRSCALIVTDTLLQITFGGPRWGMVTVRSVKRQLHCWVHGMRRPAHLERPQQSVGKTGQCGGEGVLGHAPPQGPCENLTCALKWLANLQIGGGNLVDTIFEGLQE